MKTPLPLICVLALSLVGCQTPEKLARNNATTQQWLAASAGVPKIDLSGSWYAEDWGDIHFTQSGNHVTGHIGEFPVGGVTNGDKAYLAISEDGWTYYTAVLEKPTPNRLAGVACNGVPFRETKSYPIAFYRTNP